MTIKGNMIKITGIEKLSKSLKKATTSWRQTSWSWVKKKTDKMAFVVDTMQGDITELARYSVNGHSTKLREQETC